MNFSAQSKEYMNQLDSDLFVIGCFHGGRVAGECFAAFDSALEGQLSTMIQDEPWLTKHKTVTIVPTLHKLAVKKVVLVGLGEQEKLSLDKVKKAVGKAIKEVGRSKATEISICLDSFSHDTYTKFEIAHAIAESSVLASYSFNDYKTNKEPQVTIKDVHVIVCSEGLEDVEQGLETGFAYAQGTCLARDLVNTPGNLMTPSLLAAQAVKIAEKYGMEYHVLEREDMEKIGMGALLAVAQGSEQPPKMIVLKYQGKDQWDDVLAYVGKGLTFDTGGISLKPALDMHEMKMDMGGSAAVLGAMEVIGRLKPECNILAVIPSTENMPGGKALKPGDVITSLSGKTIEVRNTDAEGRLILADGITYAKQLGANYIVDLATLTGAIIIALGHCTTGAITNNEDLMIEVLESAQEAGELMWRLPNFDEYLELVKSSDVADLNNAPGRPGGSITAGLFLGEFAEDTPWVHLDIAGTAWNKKANELGTAGGTGVMVRTLAELAERHADKVK